MGPNFIESQPDTQPVTQTLEEAGSSSEEMDISPPRYWGRLYPATRGVGVRDLTDEQTLVGKTSDCNVLISSTEVSPLVWNAFSKRHFEINRIISNNDPLFKIKIELTDLSLNGTFVNGIRVPKDKPHTLCTNDVIAVAKPDFKLFVFMESNLPRHEHNVIQKHYAVSRVLGSGSYGEVKLVFSKESGEGYAMKAINKAKFINNDKKMNTEIRILQSISHPNVIKLVEEYDSPSHKYLILQYMEGGDLCERITKNKFLPEAHAKLYFHQLINGMTYLHSKDIVHRDLKPENVLLASSDVVTLVKITDFGLSKILESGSIMQTICGTKMYAAPEVLESQSFASYTGKVDVWSLGVILFVCLSGKTPFKIPDEKQGGKSVEEQIREAKYSFKDPRWPSVSREAKLLIRRMMMKDPDRRISMANIRKSSWLNDEDVAAKVRDLVKDMKIQPSESLVNKENKRCLNISEEFDLPLKRAKMDTGIL